jgi:hypothetical protein
MVPTDDPCVRRDWDCLWDDLFQRTQRHLAQQDTTPPATAPPPTPEERPDEGQDYAASPPPEEGDDRTHDREKEKAASPG